jgi:RNA polymerase sigma factor (sigma-70 family)
VTREVRAVAGGGTASAPSEDAQWMARVQDGDEAAFAALMERWELPVKAVIGRIVLNAREAEDLAQETFVRVWQQREKFRRGAEFRPWLFAIGVNLARNRLRWWRRRPTVALDDWSPVDLRDTPQVNGRQALERGERIAAVQAAVAALPPDLREALVLFEYEHLAHAEIAEVVGATTKAVETRIHRAREKLRAALRATP